MPAMLKMTVPLAKRLANRKAGKPYLNEIWGSYTAQPSRPLVYYVEARAGLRDVGFADEIVNLRHQGWYTDREFQDAVMRGAVYQLPAHDGTPRYVAGYRYTGGDDTGATLFFDTLFNDKEDAARMADEHARVAAEEECDYQDRERERLAAEEAEEDRLNNLADCHPPLIVG